MKLLIILFVSLFFSSYLLGQYHYQSLTDYVNTFENAKIASESKIQEVINKNLVVMERLSTLDIKILALRKHIESLPVRDFLDIIDKRAKAYEDDLYKPQEFWLQHDELIGENSAKDSIRFGIYEGILRTNLEQLYGNAIAHLILSPVVLKVKIIKMETESLSISKDDWIGLRVQTAEIQDIIKGHNHFKVGETIQFYYIPFWLQKGNRFSINECYFISLLAVISNKDGKKRLALDVNIVNDGIVKITQDTVMDEENYFGLGKLSWTEFKNKIFSSLDIKLLKGDIK